MRSFYTWSCLFCILGVTFCKLTFRVREKVEILRELRITCVGVGRIAVGRDTCIKGLKKKKWKNEHNAKYRSNHNTKSTVGKYQRIWKARTDISARKQEKSGFIHCPL